MDRPVTPEKIARIPCARCGVLIIRGALKCKACKAWQPSVSDDHDTAPRVTVATSVLAIAVASVIAILVTTQRRVPAGSKVPQPAPITAPAATGAGPAPSPQPPSFRVRELTRLDARPLDVLFSPRGDSVYVSTDDGKLREYAVQTGELLHQVSVPAQGDELRLLYGRYLAVLRHEDAAHVPVIDVFHWDQDPVLLHVGANPGDITELFDGQSVVASSSLNRTVARFDLKTGNRIADIKLPQEASQLLVLRIEGEAVLATVGAAGGPGSAWLDLFDPLESPFGATRRTIPLGRDPARGRVGLHRGTIAFVDKRANTLAQLDVIQPTPRKEVHVGRSPIAVEYMHDDATLVTVNAGSRSLSVIDARTLQVTDTLVMDEEPGSSATSVDGSVLFVGLGGTRWPPEGSGVDVYGGRPLRKLDRFPTGSGCGQIATHASGRAVVANHSDRSLSLLEPAKPD